MAPPLVRRYGLDAVGVNRLLSKSLLMLYTFVVDFDFFDPTAAPHPGPDAYAGISYNLLVRVTEIWERTACSVINGAHQRDQGAVGDAYERGSSISTVTPMNTAVSLRMRMVPPCASYVYRSPWCSGWLMM